MTNDGPRTVLYNPLCFGKIRGGISCTWYICRVLHKEVRPTHCGGHLFMRYPTYMLGTGYTKSKNTPCNGICYRCSRCDVVRFSAIFHTSLYSAV